MKVNMLLRNTDLVKDPEGGYRGTGRTTGIAFSTIGEAMRNPCKAITVVDHYNSRFAIRDLLAKIARIIKDLQLLGFTINSSYGTLTFNPYAEIPDSLAEEITINGKLYRRV